MNFPSGEGVKIPYTTPTRNGYTFKGWDYSSAGETVCLNPGDIISPKTSITLYAVWESNITNYTIKFNRNGADGGSIPDSITKEGTSTSVIIGDISSNVPTKTGYIFRGWSSTQAYNQNYRIAYNSGSGGGTDSNDVSATITGSNWTY